MRHDSSLGQSAWSVSSIGDRYHQQPCCYGTHTGSLRLRHFSGITSTWHDIECEEIDPREIDYDGAGVATTRGRPLTHAYQKLGMQVFQRLRADLDPFVAILWRLQWCPGPAP